MTEQNTEQVYLRNRVAAIDALAKKAGFDDDAFAHTEFSLIPFFESIIEECAQIAEAQARVYTGENNEGKGCLASADAIRAYGKMIGNEINKV